MKRVRREAAECGPPAKRPRSVGAVHPAACSTNCTASTWDVDDVDWHLPSSASSANGSNVHTGKCWQCDVTFCPALWHLALAWATELWWSISPTGTTTNVPAEVVSFLQSSSGPGGREALEELRDILDQPPQRKRRAYKRGSSGSHLSLTSDAPKTATLKAAGRTLRYFNTTHRYLLDLEREAWKCCRGYCLKDVNKRMIIARAAIWGAKEVTQRRRDLMDLTAWCKVWAQGDDPHYELRLFGKRVCSRAFACAHGETARTFSRRKVDVDTAVGDHIPKKVAFRARGHRVGIRREDCSGWLRDTLSAMAQPLPNKTVRGATGEERTREFLPTGVFSTLNDVYQYYCGHILSQPDNDGVEMRPASFQTFRRAWLTNFFQVSAHPRRPRTANVRQWLPAVGCLVAAVTSPSFTPSRRTRVSKIIPCRVLHSLKQHWGWRMGGGWVQFRDRERVVGAGSAMRTRTLAILEINGESTGTAVSRPRTRMMTWFLDASC